MAAIAAATGQANQGSRRSVANPGGALRTARAVCSFPSANQTRSALLPSTPCEQRLAHQATTTVFAKPHTLAQTSAAPTGPYSSMSHCYVRGLVVTTRQSPLTSHAKLNRKLSATLGYTNCDSPITHHAPSNRHSARLEMAKNPIKWRVSLVLIVT